MHRLAALLLALLLPACALQPDYIEVRAPAPQVSTPVPGAERVRLAVETRDNRPFRDRVSNKINGYGMEMAPIVATNDVIVETREAISADLRGRGFQFNGNDGRLELEFSRFYSRFQTGFWSGSANAEISLNFRALAPDGRIVFSRVFNAEAVLPGVGLANGSNAKLALDMALARLVRMVGDDQDLLRALAGLAPAPAPTPDPEPVRRRRVGV